jgi:hypothetical protein
MATRFRQAPVPYRPGYRGPIDPSFRYGQAPQFFGRVAANQLGIGSIPFVGDKIQNLMTRGFTRLGQFGQRLPGGKRVGNALNFLLGNANRVMDFQEKVVDLTNPLELTRQFTGGQGQGQGDKDKGTRTGRTARLGLVKATRPRHRQRRHSRLGTFQWGKRRNWFQSNESNAKISKTTIFGNCWTN